MSKTKFPLFDTSSVIRYRKEISSSKLLISKMRLSIIVFYELTATTAEKSNLQLYEKWLKIAVEKERLLAPAVTDWLETAKMIRRLRFGEKTASHGKTPKLSDTHRLQNDALIARTAWTNDCFVVTDNLKDFSVFLPFMKNLEIISAKDFFS